MEDARAPRERVIRVRNVGYDKPGRWLLPFRRWGTLPFEALIGWLGIISGLFGLLGARTSLDPLDAVLPGWAVSVFQAGYALAGMGLLVGLGAARREIESFGLVLFASSVIVRAVAQAYLLGLTPATWVAVAFDVAIVVACTSRLTTLIRNEVIVRYKEIPGSSL